MRNVQNSKGNSAVAAVATTPGIDNIITISTASITEAHCIDDDTTDLKIEQEQQQQPDKKYVQHNGAHTVQTHKILSVSNSNSNSNSNGNDNGSKNIAVTSLTTAAAKRKFRALCHPTHWVSFQDNIADVHHRKGRRLHGLQLPLHPLQLFGWLVLILFGLASYCVLIPSFNATLQGPLYGLITGLYIVHIISHLTALLTDPADKELLRVHRNDRIVPEFDRSKHTHVIENGRCHLCNIRTSSSRTKHCSVCNKCVGKFDHHCKWLNHCIGSRNYVAFLMCVVSAVIATLVIVAAVIGQIVLYYAQPSWLSCYWCSSHISALDASDAALFTDTPDKLNGTITAAAAAAAASGELLNLTLNETNGTIWLLEESTATDDLLNATANTTLQTLLANVTATLSNSNETELTTNKTALLTTATTTTALTTTGISLNDTIFLILIGILGLLAAITAGLLLHLCFFHIYISFLGLTTYEYIRNQRQAQEAKTKQLQNVAATTWPKNGSVHFSTQQEPSKKAQEQQQRQSIMDCGQIFCCSSVRHPNDLDAFAGTATQSQSNDVELGQLGLHCCVNSREQQQQQQQQQRAAKTYYICSLLEERAHNARTLTQLAQLSSSGAPYDTLSLTNSETAANMAAASIKTFHCCSSFAATSTQRRLSGTTTKASLVSDLETAAAALSANRARSYLQYTERCTFCTFRVRSPMLSKRTSVAGTRSSANLKPPIKPPNGKRQSSSNAATATAAAANTEQRCCMKSISKHQRWRRKWYCCSSNVPDSPDVPNDFIAALAYQREQSTAAKLNAVDLPVQYIKKPNNNNNNNSSSGHSSSGQQHTNTGRTWPLLRFRHMMRMLSRYRRRARCRHHATHVTANAANVEQVKQNQIRPLQLHNQANGYYDSSSTQPATTSSTGSELSSETSIYASDTSNLPTPTAATIETILPTSVIRDDTCMTYTMPMGMQLPPALPPPTRRKIPHTTDLEEFAETLGFVTHPSNGANSSPQLQQQQRLPSMSNNAYRRARRKHFLRQRSPTLSPIHESGLSNPTSPQPGRHNSYANSNQCSPASVRATADNVVLNKNCGLMEAAVTLIQASSANSLHSLSSNSSNST